MKTKRAKQTATLVTIIFAALIAAIILMGKAVANKPKPSSRTKTKKITKVIDTKKAKPAATPPSQSVAIKNVPINKTNVKPSNASVATKNDAPTNQITPQTSSESAAMKSILASTTGLSPNALKLGLNAYQWAVKHGGVKKPYLTIVDFSIPSKEKRMWVINLNTNKVLMKTLVANGKNSGTYKATRFSNASGSLESSLGVYVTGVQYYGNDGLSLHVKGLQPGVNSNAYGRAIEFHGAAYVSPSFAAAHGYVGRSWGCFALDKVILPKVIGTIKDGSVVFAYASGNAKDFTPYAA